MTTRISEATRASIATAWPSILTGLAAGELVHHVLKTHGISPQEMRCYRTSTAGAQVDWDAAREDSADAFMDEAMTIARNPVKIIPSDEPGKEPTVIRLDSAHARNAIDTLKWAARIRNPRLYGEKAQLDVNVRTVDLTRIIEAANARIAQGRVIEHNSGSDAAHARALQLLESPTARALADLM